MYGRVILSNPSIPRGPETDVYATNDATHHLMEKQNIKPCTKHHHHPDKLLEILQREPKREPKCIPIMAAKMEAPGLTMEAVMQAIPADGARQETLGEK